MSTYADQAAVEAYIPGWTTVDPDALEQLLLQAERDIDGLLGPIAIADDSLTGLKLDPGDLQAWEATALSNAVCAQVWHLSLNSNGAGVGAAIAKTVKGPEFEKTLAIADGTKVSRYGPRVASELRPIGHLRNLSGRAVS